MTDSDRWLFTTAVCALMVVIMAAACVIGIQVQQLDSGCTEEAGLIPPLVLEKEKR